MRTFPGGVHPQENKNSSNKQIIKITPPKDLVIPVCQHIGAPAIPCVKVNDYVKKGQKIADASGVVSANIHSSVSGVVKAIEKRMHPNGTYTQCIIIENDEKYTICDEFLAQGRDYSKMSSNDIIQCIKDAGIVGIGGATFPTHIKLTPPPEAKIDYIILNGAECEPYLTSDHRLMIENPSDVIEGLIIMMQIFNLNDGYIGIENNKPDAIAIMKKEAEKIKDKNIHIIPLKTKYPQGSEKQLIYSITKRKIKSGQLPWQIGCIVSNVDTAAVIKQAVVNNIPLTDRIVTVAGDALNNCGNFLVPIGTKFSYVIEEAGGLKTEIKKAIMGGPMMGTAVPNTEVPVIKGTSGILAFSQDYARLDDEFPCIRCGKCVYVCPMNLQPNQLDSSARLCDYEKLKKLSINDCIECGSCAYVCPSKRRQVQQIRIAKLKLKNNQQNS